MLCFATMYSFAQVNPGLKLTINGKAINCANSAFGKALVGDVPFCGEVVLIDSKGGATPTATTKLEGCDSILNAAALKGKIALIRRGTCLFPVKVANAQKAGAIAVIAYENIANNPLVNMTGADASITIPSARISLEDANVIINDLKANKTITACMTVPARSISAVYGNNISSIAPLSQSDTIRPLIAIINKGADTIKKILYNVEYTSPTGKKTKIKSIVQDIPPLGAGIWFVDFLEYYQPTEKGNYTVKYYGNYLPDTSVATFALSDYTFSGDNGTVTTAGTAFAAASFAAAGKKFHILNYYKTGKKGGRATYATFGMINAAALKDRNVAITVWETSYDKLGGIKSALTNINEITEGLAGDATDYTFTGKEKGLINVPLTDGQKKYITLKPNTPYILTMEYDGSAYKDSIAPQYTLGKAVPIRWLEAGVFGAGIMTGTGYFGGGWSATDDPIGRLQLEGFTLPIGTAELTSLKADEVQIFPNPAKSIVNVKLDMEENHQKVELGIFDINGRLIQQIDVQDQHGVTPINIGSYPSGTYFFSVKTEKSFATEKVIKE